MTTIKVKLEFRIGETVYVKTDTSQERHLVVGVLLKEKDTLYQLSLYGEITYLYGFEISKEQDELYKIEGKSSSDIEGFDDDGDEEDDEKRI